MGATSRSEVNPLPTLMRLASVLLLAAGCAGTDTAAEPTPTKPAASVASAAAPTTTTTTTTTTTLAFTEDGLGATLERYREDDVPNRVQIQANSIAAGPVSLTKLALVWPGFVERPPSAGAYTVAPGQVVDLPVPLGEPICSDPPEITEDVPGQTAFAVGTAQFGIEPPAEIRIPITDVRGVLGRLYVAACRVEAVRHTATISFGPTWTDTEFEGQPAAAGSLRIERNRGTAPVVISVIRGSVLLRFRPEKPPSGTLVAMGAGEAHASVPLLLVQSGDCRPHALADSKHTFFLAAVVRIGDAPEAIIDIFPDAPAQLQLTRMINKSCGVG